MGECPTHPIAVHNGEVVVSTGNQRQHRVQAANFNWHNEIGFRSCQFLDQLEWLPQLDERVKDIVNSCVYDWPTKHTSVPLINFSTITDGAPMKHATEPR